MNDRVYRKWKNRRPSPKVLFVSAVLFLGTTLFGEPAINLVTWNIESGGNDPGVIAAQLAEFITCDLVTLIETDDANLERYADVFGPEYDAMLSQSGARYNDHIAVLFNAERFELTKVIELHEYKGTVITTNVTDGGKRSPLILQLRDRESGTVFYYISVHLARTDAAQRKLEALVLREWILNHNAPAIIVGDFNFDYDFHTDDPGNYAYKLFTWYDRIDWIEPVEMIDSNYSANKSGKETYRDSILDFVFAANGARDWDITSRIIVRPGDFPDTEATSDHRPVSARILFQ